MRRTVLAIFLAALVSASAATAQTYSLSVGVAKQNGEGNEYWKAGISAALTYYYLSRAEGEVQLFGLPVTGGVRAGYDGASANDGKFIANYRSDTLNVVYDVTSSPSILEIGPFVRLWKSLDEDDGPHLFIEGGGAWYFVDLSAIVTAHLSDNRAIQWDHGYQRNQPGGHIGLGVAFFDRFEASALYHYIFTRTRTKFFVVNAAVLFGGDLE